MLASKTSSQNSTSCSFGINKRTQNDTNIGLAGISLLEYSLEAERLWYDFKNGATMKLQGKSYTIRDMEKDIIPIQHPR